MFLVKNLLHPNATGAACVTKIWRVFGCTQDIPAGLMDWFSTQPFQAMVGEIGTYMMGTDPVKREACMGPDRTKWPSGSPGKRLFACHVVE